MHISKKQIGQWLKGLLAVVCLLAVSVQCSKERTAEEQASAAALESYEQLIAGHYEQFLKRRSGIDSLPDSYREQLMTAYKQFMIGQKQEHGGLKSASVKNAVMDSTLNVMQVFLILNYTDSLQEEIVVPMVSDNGEWKMK